MRALVTILVTTVLLLAPVAHATVINIPDDYPTIQEGIDASSDGDTVLVQPGAYVENINFNGHNVVLASLFLTTQDTIYIYGTVIDGNRAGSVITFESGEDSTTQLLGFTIRDGYASHLSNGGGGVACRDHSNPTIMSNIISDNRAFYYGGGIYCDYCDPKIYHNTIRDNSGYEGGGGIFCASSNPSINDNVILGNWGYAAGGIDCCGESNPTIINNSIIGNGCSTNGGGICCSSNSNPTISNNTIADNSAVGFCGVGGGICVDASQPTIKNNVINGNAAQYGGGVACGESAPNMINNTITGNLACGPGPDYGYGGGLFCVVRSNPAMTNNIFWADTAETEGKEFYVDVSSFPTVTYCDIEDTLWPGVGNISIDPLFRDPENRDFHLQSITSPDCGGPGDSPCIDAGDSSIIDTLISCDWGLGTVRSDMGAYGGGDSAQAGIPEQEENIPTCFYLSQNYPNPFNTTTIIHYQVPVTSYVKLDIYNLLGEKVATLLDSRGQKGYRSVVWEASLLSSGLYFYRLSAGDFAETRRMILVR